MKKYTELELGRILEKHSLWLAGDHNGERANLSGADLREADFGGANLSRSDFDTNRWNECAPGIPFFISRQEAVDFNI